MSRNLKAKICRTVTLPVVSCVCGTWSLTLREEHMLEVFENRVLRENFGSRWWEVTAEWVKLLNENVHD